ncbi:hypothetical protein [Azospirillum melinis]
MGHVGCSISEIRTSGRACDTGDDFLGRSRTGCFSGRWLLRCLGRRKRPAGSTGKALGKGLSIPGSATLPGAGPSSDAWDARTVVGASLVPLFASLMPKDGFC